MMMVLVQPMVFGIHNTVFPLLTFNDRFYDDDHVVVKPPH